MGIKGSCCCGAVRFELAEAPTMMGTCHCTRCRKSGASHMVFVRREAFRLIAGQSQVATHEASPPYKYNRSFCRICGSALGELGSQESSFPIVADCLDDDIALTNGFHEFVAEKPSWLEIGDRAPQFEGHPPSGGE